MDEYEFDIAFDGTPAERGAAAAELRDAIMSRRGPKPTSAAVVRRDDSAQDAGQVLEVVLNAGALLAIAEGLKVFFAKRSSDVTIKTKEGEIVLKGDSAQQDVAAIVEALRKRPRRRR